jgi:hypothetical protein
VQDKELYRQILEFQSPWSVKGVELDHEQSEIRVKVEHPRVRKFVALSARQNSGATTIRYQLPTLSKTGNKVVIHTKLEPMKTVARTIKERLPNVVSYCTHRIANAVAEGMNSKIMSIKRRVGGFRNIDNFKTAIFFYCGGLDVYPR